MIGKHEQQQDDIYKDFVIIEEDTLSNELFADIANNLELLGLTIDSIIDNEQDLKLETDDDYVDLFAKIIPQLDVSNPSVRENLLNLFNQVRGAVHAEASKDDKNVDKNAKAKAIAKTILKGVLCTAAVGATLYLGGPYCAIAARKLFSIGYVALFGTPSTFGYYMAFLPMREHFGALAYSYGPKLITALGSAIGVGAKLVQKKIKGEEAPNLNSSDDREKAAPKPVTFSTVYKSEVRDLEIDLKMLSLNDEPKGEKIEQDLASDKENNEKAVNKNSRRYLSRSI